MRRIIGSSLMVSAVLASFACSIAATADDAALFVGTKACAMCHKKADGGDQFGKWQGGPHAKAIATLGTAEAKAMGAKVGFDAEQAYEKIKHPSPNVKH